MAIAVHASHLRLSLFSLAQPVAELSSAVRERPPTAEREHRQQMRQQGETSSLRPSDAEVPEAVRSALERPRTAAFQDFVASCSGGHMRSQPGQAQQLAAQQPQPPSLDPSEWIDNYRLLQDYMTATHPSGRILKLQLHSTWGDPHYIGLNGIELLAPSGAPIRLPPTALSADPPSIASLPQLARDPRTVDKLVDGVNASYDDRHMFLAPFTPGRVNVVRIDLGPRPQSFAVLRLWNYAKTTTRGVRQFEVMLDGMVLYQGTARPAPPRVGDAVEASSDFVQSVVRAPAPRSGATLPPCDHPTPCSEPAPAPMPLRAPHSQC